MQKKVLAFLVISGILMVGYLLAIAGPSPPWGVHDSDYRSGSVTDSKYGGSISCNVYVAYNTVWIDENTRNYRTYHWWYASKGAAGTPMYFKYEYNHGLAGGIEDDKDTTSPWEDDLECYSYIAPGTPVKPYTSIRPGEGEGEVKAQLDTTAW